MLSIKNIWETLGKNWKIATVIVVLLTVFSVTFYYLNGNSDLDRKSHEIAVQLSKRIGVPYQEAYVISRNTLLESRNLPERGGFFENIWYGSPRIRYVENTIETRLRRSGFSGFWLGSDVRSSVRMGLREAAAKQQKK